MKKSLIFIISVCIIIIIVILGVSMINKKKEIYRTTYGFAFGSRRVKIYDNGDVYDDLEIEEPRHKENYEFLKKLSKKELNALKDKLKSTSNDDELREYVIELVYGVKKFDDMGRY